jgi:two-component system, cell cycle sensor histidine kinase and response regulator CckA
MPQDQDGNGAGTGAQTVRSLRFLLVLAVAGAAYPVAGESSLSWRFWTALAVFFASNLAFCCCGARALRRPAATALVFLVDSALLVFLLFELGERSAEFYILFALLLLVSAVGRRPAGAVAATAVTGALYALLVLRREPGMVLLSGVFLTRLAFFFAFSLFVAHLGGEADRARRAARESEARCQTYLDVADVMLVALDARGAIVLVNRTGARILEHDADGLVGRDWFDTCLPPSCREARRASFRDAMAGRVDRVDGDENPVLTRLGAERLVAWRHAILRDDGGAVHGMLSAGEDVTERRQLESLLRQAHKMEAVGQLAGGIAHDFNNMLFVINGRAELELRRLAPDDPGRSALDLIRRTGDRAAAFTRQLLAFSRRQILQPRTLDLNAVVTDMLKMLRRLIREDIELQTALDPGLHPIQADPGQVEQVILNLAVNARDAMPRGGLLTIETANVTPDETFRRRRAEPVRPGPHVRLTVRDTGCGMDERVKAHLFEPFFTTKEQGQGTGLGLATIYGIVRQSEGHIEVRSEPGRGTTFEIFFPAGGGDPPAIGPRETPLARGTETILLVEDVDGVRDLVRDMLTEWGYAVLEASNGEEALARAAKHDGPIHLLLTDIVMPKMGGLDLARRLGEARPGLRVLYMSGYADHAGLPVEPAPGTGFLAKPVKAGVLAHTVRELLDGPAPARP